MTTALLSVCLLTIGQEPPDDRQLLAQVHEQAKAFAQAFHKDDHARLADLTHAKSAEKIGSRARVMQAWRKKTLAYRNQGLRLERYEVDAPKDVVKIGADWLCIVPAQLTFQAIDGSASLKSYLLGLSHNQGKTWRFLDGADGDTAKNVKAWLPKLPDSVALPGVSKARVDKPDPQRAVFSSIAANFKVCFPDRWDQGRQPNVQLHLERGDNSVYFIAVELNQTLEEVIQSLEYERETGKRRKLSSQKDMTVAGENARFFRYDQSTDQELQQVYGCVFNHQGFSYRVMGLRKGGDLQEFEEDYFSLLQRFAFLKDRAAWVKQFEGAPAKAVLLGGLASFEVQRPRWTEDTFDNPAENQSFDFITYRYLPGNGWMRVELHEAQGTLDAELQEILSSYRGRLAQAKHKSVTFTTPAGKWPGWEVQGAHAGAPRVFCLTAVINDGVAAWMALESATSQLEDTRFDFEQLLESFHLQAQSKPAGPVAFPMRPYGNERRADARVGAIVKKAARLYPGLKAHQIVSFSADGKQALLVTPDSYVLEDLVTKKRSPLPLKGLRPLNLVVSPDRKWIAYQVNDEITVYPFGFGFSKKVRAHALMIGFGPGNKDLLILTTNQKPRYDYRDEYRDEYRDARALGVQYSTSRLERLPLDNTPKKPLFDWPLIRVANFSLSPNGQLLAVVTNRDYPRTQQYGGYLYLCKPDGAELRLLNKDPCDYRALAWSADGKWIYALRRLVRNQLGGGVMYDVERIAANTGNATNLTRCGRITNMWAGGADLFLELRDASLPMAQQGIYRISADELAKATAPFPAPKSEVSGVLAGRVAKRLAPSLGNTSLKEFVPTPASMERLAGDFTAAINDETGMVLEATPESLDNLRNLIDQLDLASGKHPVNVLGVGAYYGETLRKLVGAKWHIRPVPFGQWSPARTFLQNNVAEVILPFSDTYGWAMLGGRVINSYDVRTRGGGLEWLLVYPPADADDALKAGFADYLKAKKLLDQGEIDAGLKTLAGEMKKRPQNAQIARELVALCKAIERNNLVKIYTKQAVEAGIEAADLLVLYADELMRSDANKAVVYYRKAAHVGYTQSETLIKLGQAYEKTGQPALAESCWRRAYLSASDLQRIEIRRLMGMPDFRPYNPGFPFGRDFKDFKDFKD